MNQYKGQSCKNIDALHRMNFVYQAAMWFVREARENSRCDSNASLFSCCCSTRRAAHPWIVISSHYIHMMNEVAEKTTQRQSPTVKHSTCPKCKVPQIPGITSSHKSTLIPKLPHRQTHHKKANRNHRTSVAS
jgi:RNase P subunit RPR2